MLFENKVLFEYVFAIANSEARNLCLACFPNAFFNETNMQMMKNFALKQAKQLEYKHTMI